MSTDFFCKKVRLFSVCLLVSFTLACLIYAVSFKKIRAVHVGATMYFLVSKNESASVGAELTKLDGGAGYVLCDGGQAYAVWSVYFSQGEGEVVQRRLEEEGKETTLLAVGTDALYFQTWREKKSLQATVELMKIVKGCMQVLNETISRLEKGMTQEKAKNVLVILSRQLAFVSQKYAPTTNALVGVCQESAKRLDEMTGGTVYSDKLMYELCFLADEYLTLCNRFCL